MIFLFCIVLISLSAYSHPHVFVDANIKLEKSVNNKITVTVDWFFDEYTSQSLLNDYDTNQDGIFNSKETGQIQKDFKKNLQEHQYFTTLKINGKKTALKVLKSSGRSKKRHPSYKMLAAFMSEKSKAFKSFVYTFTFELPPQTKEGVIAFYDDTMFSVIFPIKKMEIAPNISYKKNELKESSCEYRFKFL